MYVHIWIYVCMYIYVCTHIYIHIYICICLYICREYSALYISKQGCFPKGDSKIQGGYPLMSPYSTGLLLCSFSTEFCKFWKDTYYCHMVYYTGKNRALWQKRLKDLGRLFIVVTTYCTYTNKALFKKKFKHLGRILVIVTRQFLLEYVGVSQIQVYIHICIHVLRHIYTYIYIHIYIDIQI